METQPSLPGPARPILAVSLLFSVLYLLQLQGVLRLLARCDCDCAMAVVAGQIWPLALLVLLLSLLMLPSRCLSIYCDADDCYDLLGWVLNY
jgi:hypothetical protein